MIYPIIAIGIVGIVVVSVLFIGSTLQESQELNTIEDKNHDLKVTILNEISGIEGTIETDEIFFENLSNEEIDIIQIRVYDDNGDYVESFDLNYTVPGNSNSNFTGIPLDLKRYLVEWYLIEFF